MFHMSVGLNSSQKSESCNCLFQFRQWKFYFKVWSFGFIVWSVFFIVGALNSPHLLVVAECTNGFRLCSMILISLQKLEGIRQLLRLRKFSLRHDWVCLVQLLTYSYTCRITVIFGTLKDCSHQINSWALDSWFSYRNVFQNSINALSKMILKSRIFVKKLKISCSWDNTNLFKFY